MSEQAEALGVKATARRAGVPAKTFRYWLQHKDREHCRARLLDVAKLLGVSEDELPVSVARPKPQPKQQDEVPEWMKAWEKPAFHFEPGRTYVLTDKVNSWGFGHSPVRDQRYVFVGERKCASGPLYVFRNHQGVTETFTRFQICDVNVKEL